MKQEFIINNGSNSVIILFAGWGMSPAPFNDIIISQDLLIVWDYNDFDFNVSSLASYSNIYIFAWSFGVYSASRFISDHRDLPICFKMAINGTLTPIDDNKGIPNNIFSGTLNSLSEETLLKFYRRMCPSSAKYRQFIASKPERDISSLRSELLSVQESAKAKIYDIIKWDKVIVSHNDLIFPIDNQIEAWKGYCDNIIEVDGGHLPNDIANIINENIINKSLLKRRFTKKLPEYDSMAVCQHHISQHLHDAWRKIDYKTGSKVLEVGCGTGFLTNLYAQSLSPEMLILNDLCNIPATYLKGLTNYKFIQGDAEIVDFGNDNATFDYIVSASAIQWFENIPKFFDKIHSLLNDDGLIVFSTFGHENMTEISNITGLSLKYLDTCILRELLSEKFEIILLEEEIMTLKFDTPIDVLRHIRATGVNSITEASKWNKSQLKEFTANYKNIEDKYPLTYNPIYIIARKK
ncbi:MAG: malonyl-ACP O-methyltransferase BioC [Muribaculaceae bacterium]